MRIAVIGTGNVGGTLGKRWAQRGHSVVFGTRDPKSDKARALLAAIDGDAKAASIRDAAQACDVVVIATPWGAAEQSIREAGDLAGKVVVDCSNPIADGLKGLSVGHATSAAEMIAGWAKGARVVKAFNTAAAKTMDSPVMDGGVKAAMFYCGDDEKAREVVGQLVAEVGFDPVDCGPLRCARYLEPMAMLFIDMAVLQRKGADIAFGFLRRSKRIDGAPDHSE